MKVHELKSWLEECDDDTDVIIDYACDDDWYNYYGSDISINFDGEDLILEICN